MREKNSNRGGSAKRVSVANRLKCALLVTFVACSITLSAQERELRNEQDSVLCSTTLYFMHNSVWFDYANEAEIFKLLDIYTTNVFSKLQIEAWCDDSGVESKNNEMSQLRAKNVRRFFRHYGVISEDVELVRGNGVDRGAATDSIARRAEVKLVMRVPKRTTHKPDIKYEAEPEQPQESQSIASPALEEVAEAAEEVVADEVSVEDAPVVAAAAPVIEPAAVQPQDSVLRNDQYVRVVSSSRGADFKRFDRQVDHSIKYAYKGEFLMGAAVSYAEVESDNSELMLLLDGIDASGDMFTVKPYLGYFYKDNRCVGLRFGYSSLGGELGSATVDLGESNDISLDIPYVSLNSESYSYGLFHRTYVGLDKAGRAGLFAEIELSGVMSNGDTAYESSDGVIERSSSKSLSAELSFNPGVAVYVMPNVCATLSFGFGGLNYKTIKQYDAEGVQTGGRESSKMSFKFNITAINCGISIHLWGKGK